MDFADQGYQVCENGLPKIGKAEKDYRMLRSWGFADKDYFTLEKIQWIAEITKRHCQNQAITFENLLERLKNKDV